MHSTRRQWLQYTATGAILGASGYCANEASSHDRPKVPKEILDRILEQPVLNTSFVKDPVVVASLELLHVGKNFLIRTRSTDGVEVVTVPNPTRMAETYPIVLNNLFPVFLKRDARQLEALLWDSYRHGSNYKLQGLALWPGTAAIEMALLELMAQTVRRPVADFFGGVVRRDIPVYFASGNRGNRPAEEIEYLQKLVAGSGAKAIKFRLGGRMNRNVDSLPGRTEALIPLVRKVFGDQMTLYADSTLSESERSWRNMDTDFMRSLARSMKFGRPRKSRMR